MGLTYGESLSLTEDDSVAYAQVVAAMVAKPRPTWRVRSSRRFEALNKLKKEHALMRHEKHTAVRQAEDPVKYEFANKRTEDAVKTAQEVRVTINEQKGAEVPA